MQSIASLPCKIVLGDLIQTSFQEIMLSSGVFRRETASGFYPWCNVVSPRKRVAEGLCGWRHGNSFPMTQSAQSHRQMRSIPLCSKAVFYVFVFGSIHNSATLHNLSPGIFHWTQETYSSPFIVKKAPFCAFYSPYCTKKPIFVHYSTFIAQKNHIFE